MFGVVKMDVDSYERYADFETGVLHTISSQVYLAEWFCLGHQFGNIPVWDSLPKDAMVILGNVFPKLCRNLWVVTVTQMFRKRFRREHFQDSLPYLHPDKFHYFAAMASNPLI